MKIKIHERPEDFDLVKFIYLREEPMKRNEKMDLTHINMVTVKWKWNRQNLCNETEIIWKIIAQSSEQSRLRSLKMFEQIYCSIEV